MEKTQLPEHKNKTKGLLIIAGIVLIFLFGIILGSVLSSNSSSPSTNQTGLLNLLHPASQQQTNQPSNLSNQQANQTPQTPARQAPSVYFETYKNNAISPNIANSLTVYALKDSFSSEEVHSLASKLGITTFETDSPDYAAAYNLTDIDKKGILVFNKKTGAFNYKSYSGAKPGSFTQGQDVSQEALSYLADLGLPTEYLSCPITYQRKPMTSLTFVECHYDWRNIGLPYLNLIGLLNVPAETSLGSLKLGGVTSDSPVDASIININTGDNGKARPNDFNTVTVTIQDGGIIREVSSNIRWIQSPQSVSSSNILTPEEALSQFLAHNAKLSLTIPAGEGSFNYDYIYQNSKAEAREATITDYVLSYLEKPQSSSQKFLSPFYTIRGIAVLTTGYRVRFVQTVPAIKDNSYSVDFQSNNINTNLNQSVAKNTIRNSLKSLLSLFETQAYAQSSQTPCPSPISVFGMQLKTFMIGEPCAPPGQLVTPTAAQSETRSPMQSPNDINNSSDSSTPQASDATNTKCPELGRLLPVKINVPGYGEVTLGNISHTFYYESGPVPLSEIQKVKNAFYHEIENQYAINVAKHLTSDQKGLITSSSTVDDIKASFPTINRNPTACAFPYNFPEAPLYNCPEDFLGEGPIFLQSLWIKWPTT